MSSNDDDIESLFPIHIDEHGTEMTIIKVGCDQQAQEFTIHKWALVKASPYFSSALTGGFKEAKDNIVHLQENDPIAFKVFYQYIYSGNVHTASFYSKGSIPDDVLWLRTFKLAHATGVHTLVHITYNRLRVKFDSTKRSAPSMQFIFELFDQESPQQELEDYIAAHAAWWILNACGDWTDWVSLMEAVPYFASAVACQITKRQSEKYKGSKEHPTDDPNFDKDTLFPAPIAELPGKDKSKHEEKSDEKSTIATYGGS